MTIPATPPDKPLSPPIERPWFHDFSIVGIVAGNALGLWFALTQDWPIMLLLWPYWAQSLIIGWFARRRILALQQFSTANLFVGSKPVEATPEVRDQIAFFLALHFGIFHAVYFGFLLAGSLLTDAAQGIGLRDLGLLALLCLAFWIGQALDFRRVTAEDRSYTPSLGKLLLLPYPRVLPMHLIIICGAFIGGGPVVLTLFVLLKTAADVTMHVLEQRWLRNGKPGMAVHIGGD